MMTFGQLDSKTLPKPPHSRGRVEMKSTALKLMEKKLIDNILT